MDNDNDALDAEIQQLYSDINLKFKALKYAEARKQLGVFLATHDDLLEMDICELRVLWDLLAQLFTIFGTVRMKEGQ